MQKFILPFLGALILTIGTAAISIETFAQEQVQTDPVGRRKPSGYVVEGRTWHGMIIRPSIAITSIYNDNIYAQPQNQVDDIEVLVTPLIDIAKPYQDHSFGLKLGTTISRFKDNTDENTEEFTVGHNGTITATNDLKLNYAVSSTRSYLDRSTPGTAAFTTEKIEQQIYEAVLGATHRFNRIIANLTGSYKKTIFENGTSDLTGQPIIFSDNNRVTKGLNLTLSYEFLGSDTKDQDHLIFLSSGYSENSFDTPGRGSNQTSFLSGFQTSYKDLFFGRFGIGYLQQSFDQAATDDEKTVNFFVSASYNPISKLTLTLFGEREIDYDNDTSLGVISTTLDFQSDY